MTMKYSNMRPKVSLVVPIYNVEVYLPKCIDSLLAQTLDDIEIILVDDGSPDCSGMISDEYARKHANISVVHQRNSGLGPARNSGMKIATGEYIGFVDSDDWANPTMFEKLYNAAVSVNADICVGGHCNVSNGDVIQKCVHPYSGRVLSSRNDILKVREELFGHLPEDTEKDAFPMQVWTSIYRRDFVISSGLQFRNILSEDTMFNLDAYRSARSIVFIGETGYCYRNENQPSIMRSFSEKKLEQYEDFIQALYSEAKNSDNAEICCLRVKRAAIQYVRLYAGLVENSNLSLSMKKQHLRVLVETDMMRKYCAGYPLSTLPRGQRVFQQALEGKHFYVALLLLWAKRTMRQMNKIIAI